MRTMAVILIFLWMSAIISGPGEKEKQDRIDSLMAINQTLMNNLKKANSDIQMANEIIENPDLVLRLNGEAVQVFREDTSHKKQVNLKNGTKRNK